MGHANKKRYAAPLIRRWHAEQESPLVAEVKAQSREAGRRRAAALRSAASGVTIDSAIGLANHRTVSVKSSPDVYTSFIAAAAGIIGLTLPFGVYTFATSTLAFVSNPIIVGGVALFGGHFAIKRATQQMRDRLVPVMVATSVIAATATNVQQVRPAVIAKLLEAAASARVRADARGRLQIERTFPALPKVA